jgi:hypothetical protein
MDEELEAPEVEEEEAAEAPEEAAPFEFIAIPPQVSFEVARVAPPSELYIGPGDELLVNVCTSYPGAWLVINARLLRPDGIIVPMQWSIKPQGNRLPYSALFPLTEGYLLSLSLVPIGVVAFVTGGQMWARAAIWRTGGTGALYRLLLSGYVTSFRSLSWPAGIQELSIGNQGWLRVFAGTNPAPGTEVCETVPSFARWRVVTFYFTLTTSATVTDRRVYLVIDDGTTPAVYMPPVAVQPANTSRVYHYASDFPYTQPFPEIALIPIPTNLLLGAGWRIRTETWARQPGDDYSAPGLAVEEWLEV